MMFCVQVFLLLLSFAAWSEPNTAAPAAGNPNYEPQVYTTESTGNIAAVNKVVEVVTNPLGDSKQDPQKSKKEETMSEPANSGSLKQLPRDPTQMSGNFRQELKRRSAASGANPNGENDVSNSNIPHIELVGKIMGHPKSVVLRVNKQIFHIVEGGQNSMFENNQVVTIRVKKITQNLVRLFVSPADKDLFLQ